MDFFGMDHQRTKMSCLKFSNIDTRTIENSWFQINIFIHIPYIFPEKAVLKIYLGPTHGFMDWQLLLPRYHHGKHNRPGSPEWGQNPGSIISN